MRARVAFLLAVPVFIALMLFAALSGECGGSGSCIATARVNDARYSLGLARGMTIQASDLAPYALATKRARTFEVVDEQTFRLGTLDPTKVLVMKLVPGQTDDAGPIGDYLLLVTFTDATAWTLTCPYYAWNAPARPADCPVDATRASAIARDFMMAGQPSGTIFHDVTVGTPEWHTTHWRVQVDAVIDYPAPSSQPPSRIPVHYLIDVDGTTGAATIYAQG